MINVVAWVAAHKAAAAGGAGVAALALTMAKKKSAAAATAPTGSTTVASSPVGATSGGTYDSTGQDVYSSIEPQLQYLENQISGSSAATTVAAPTAGPAVGSAAYGQEVWNADSAYAATGGITGLSAPTNLAAYGTVRNNQNLYALNNQSTPGADVPGGNFTVAQTLAEAQAFNSGALGNAV